MTGAAGPPLLRHATAQVHGRYFVRPPDSPRGEFWFVGFHGQGQTADQFLNDIDRVPRSPAWLAASVQGLNRHYTRRGEEIVASWMTSQDRELAIADNVAWVNTVLDALEKEFGVPRAIVFTGFSQGVAMAYRAGLLGARECAAIVAVSGDIPPELKSTTTREWPRVVALTGADDAWYTPARLEADVAFLCAQHPDSGSRVFAGAHEWTDEVAAAAGEVLEEVERSAG